LTLLYCLQGAPRFSTIKLLKWANLLLDDRPDSCSICTHILASRWLNIIFLHLCATLSCSIDYGTPKGRSFPFCRTHGPLSFAENANSITARITRLEWIVAIVRIMVTRAGWARGDISLTSLNSKSGAAGIGFIALNLGRRLIRPPKLCHSPNY
jgi:hypothetical protein